MVEVARPHYREHRAENLLLRDGHTLFDVGKDRGFDKVAFGIRAAGQAPPAEFQLRAFFFADLYVLQISIELVLVDRRPDIDARLAAIPDLQLRRALGQGIDEAVV